MTHSHIDPKLQLIFITAVSAEWCMCNDAVPDPAVVTIDYGLSSPSFKSQQGHEAFSSAERQRPVLVLIRPSVQ